MGNRHGTRLTDREPGLLERRQRSLDARSPPSLHLDHVLDRYRTGNDGEQGEQRLPVDPTRSQTVRQDATGIQIEMLARGQDVQPERRATGRRPRLDCSILGDLRIEITGQSNRVLALERTELDLEQTTRLEHAAERSHDAQRHVGGSRREHYDQSLATRCRRSHDVMQERHRRVVDPMHIVNQQHGLSAPGEGAMHSFEHTHRLDACRLS